jgi:type I site-specific restriction endonuclease
MMSMRWWSQEEQMRRQRNDQDRAFVVTSIQNISITTLHGQGNDEGEYTEDIMFEVNAAHADQIVGSIRMAFPNQKIATDFFVALAAVAAGVAPKRRYD